MDILSICTKYSKERDELLNCIENKIRTTLIDNFDDLKDSDQLEICGYLIKAINFEDSFEWLSESKEWDVFIRILAHSFIDKDEKREKMVFEKLSSMFLKYYYDEISDLYEIAYDQYKNDFIEKKLISSWDLIKEGFQTDFELLKLETIRN